MGYTPTHVRLEGDEALAKLLLRQAYVELDTAVIMAAKMGITTFGRTIPISDTATMYVSVSPAGQYINIVATGSVEEFREFEFSDTPIQDVSERICLPSFAFYQRKHTDYRRYNWYLTVPAASLPPTVDIPWKQDPSTGLYTVDTRDPIGKLISAQPQGWEQVSLVPGPDLNAPLGGVDGNVDLVDETFSGGWWGLPGVIDSLNSSYAGCDVLTWSGMQSSFTDRGIKAGQPTGGSQGLWAFGFGEPDPVGSKFESGNQSPAGNQYEKYWGLKPVFWFGGRKYFVRITTPDDVVDESFPDSGLLNPDVLGACIIADGDTDYFYVHVRMAQILEDAKRREGVYRYPVETAHEVDPANGPDWEQVGDLIYYNDIAENVNTHPALAYNIDYVSHDGFAYCHRLLQRNGTYVDLQYSPSVDIMDSHTQGWDNYIFKINLFTATVTIHETDLTENPRGTTEWNSTGESPCAGADPPGLKWTLWHKWQATRTANVATPPGGLGRIVGFFGGLDAIYTYRAVLESYVLDSSSNAEDIFLPTTYDLTGNVSESLRVRIDAYKNGDIYATLPLCSTALNVNGYFNWKYIDVGGVATPDWTKTPSGSSTGYVRNVFFHHPKIPDRWDYIERSWNTQYEKPYSGSFTLKIIQEGQTTDSKVFPVSTDGISDTADAKIATNWMPVNMSPSYLFKLHDPALDSLAKHEDIIYYPYMVSRHWMQSSEELNDIALNSYGGTQACGYANFSISQQHNIELRLWAKPYGEAGIGGSGGASESSQPPCISVLKSHKVGTPIGELAEAPGLHGNYRIEDMGLIYRYIFGAHIGFGGYGGYRHGYAGNTSAPAAVVHRPPGGVGPWVWVAQFPKWYIYKDKPEYEVFQVGTWGQFNSVYDDWHNLQLGAYKKMRHPSGNWKSCPSIPYGFLDLPDIRSEHTDGGGYASYGARFFYSKPYGWTTDEAAATGKASPSSGVYDVEFSSNVFTIAQIQALTGEDDAFLAGIGVI